MMDTEKQPEPLDRLVQINAQVLLSQRELLNQKARSAEMNVSQFVSRLITEAVVEVTPGISKQLQELNAWLGRINSNLNMLAKHANTHREKADATLIIYQLGQIGDDVRRFAELTDAIRVLSRKRKPRSAKRAAKAQQVPA
ncbi:plasmid mobilization protein [Pseudomonas sp. BF-R-01]|uniref:plasmid mobilization protein n=1 Tax=Pseudomonas sp. BF-R-01 TaxID=2832365 RepID=UPI001CC118FF|nr:hypothetical protein [Pseudomonas sp. BF-R-01]